MRLRSLFFALALTRLIAGGAIAQAAEPVMVDPFLQAAQLAKEVPTGEEFADEPTFDSILKCTDPVVCGDAVGLAGLIEQDRQKRNRWTVLTELPVLLPSYSTSTLATANDHPIIGPRISLGWESSNDFGIRGRGWWFDSAVDVEGQPLALSIYRYDYYYPSQIVSHQIDFSGGKFDLDFYKRVSHRTGDVAFGATISVAELKLHDRYTVSSHTFGGYNQPAYFSMLQQDGIVRNRGAGLGLLAKGSHRFFQTSLHTWSVFGRGRMSYLIGQWEDTLLGTLDEGDGNMAIGEAALGLEYRRRFSLADLLVQCAFEVQSWDVSQVGRVNFAGVTPGIGLNW